MEKCRIIQKADINSKMIGLAALKDWRRRVPL
jgi:hypothetical protein